jgi:hypothetical protein
MWHALLLSWQKQAAPPRLSQEALSSKGDRKHSPMLGIGALCFSVDRSLDG